MLEAAGIEPDEACRAFIPLMEKTLANIIQFGSIKALTGPISRGDYGTVKKHLEEMSKKCPEYLRFYRILAGYTVQIALTSGTINNKQADLLKKVLGEEYERR